jgi:alpha-tubulin suppressor-like RCC1 family protein
VPVAPGSSWAQVCAGHYHTLGIQANGSLWAWGFNGAGQLGTENTDEQPIPVIVAPGSTWTQVSPGDWHTLGIQSGGGFWAWGLNGNGQLGIGEPHTEQHIPVPVAPASTWVQVSAGWYHSLGIKADGSLWAWGHNGSGQLGTGNNVHVDEPIPVSVSQASTWGQVSAGQWHTLGIQADGSLWAWGSNDYGQLGVIAMPGFAVLPLRVHPGSTWTQVSAGERHTLGIQADGSLWAWGSNHNGRLGLGDNLQDFYGPTRVGSFSDWVMVRAGGSHSLGLRADGCLYSWGYNSSGQLGLGDTQERHEPTLIPTSCPALTGTHKLTVSPSGTGSGTVTGNGIDCTWNGNSSSGTCSVTLAANTVVSLNAAPGSGSTFAGWTGGSGSAAGCSGTGNCAFSITASSWVGAPFTRTGPLYLYLPSIFRN